MGQRRPTLASAALALAAALGSGCYPSGGQGKEPVDDQFYFPVSAAVTPARALADAKNDPFSGDPRGKWLIVANSDFDLAYKSGTVQALDLGDVVVDTEAQTWKATGIWGAVLACEDKRRSPSCLADPSTEAYRACQSELSTGGCLGADVSPYVRASVRIGAFASDMKIVKVYDAAAMNTARTDVSRVLLPVRGDATLTFIDAIESDGGVTLNCYAGAGANEKGHDCDASHRVGQVAAANARNLTLEGEPFAIATPDYWDCATANRDTAGNCALEPARSGGVASIVHQVSGDVSVFHDVQLYKAPPAVATPVLSYTLGGLAPGATAIASLDLKDRVDAAANPPILFVPRFLVANRSQSSLFQVSYLGDDGNLDRSVLTASALIPITTQQTGYDTRGIVVDPPGQGEGRPIRVFLASRSPASIVVGQIDPDSGQLHFYENVPLPIGPSRITRSSFLDAEGIAHTRIYVASYDSAYVISYDPDARRLGGVIKAGRGPYSIAIDEGRKLAYVANFIDGTVQIIDVSPTRRIPDPSSPLDRTKGTTVPNEFFEQVVFTVGVPQGPRT